MAAMFSALPDASTTTDEVTKFVETLLEHNQIAFDRPKRLGLKPAMVEAVVQDREPLTMPTHTISVQDGKKVLTRIRFLCG